MTPDAPAVVLGQRQHGVDRDLQPGRDQPAQAGMLVALDVRTGTRRHPPCRSSPGSRTACRYRAGTRARRDARVSMARTESAVFGFSGSTIDCATVPSMASASAVRSVFSRWSTRTLFSVTPCFQNTPAPFENSWRAAVPRRDPPCPSAAGSAPRPSCRSRAGCGLRGRATSAARAHPAGSSARRGRDRRSTGCSCPSCRR